MRLTPWIIASVSAALLVRILQKQQTAVASCQDLSKDPEKDVERLTETGNVDIERLIDQIAGEIKVTAGNAAQVVQHEIRELER
jgi:hypothetical protein